MMASAPHSRPELGDPRISLLEPRQAKPDKSRAMAFTIVALIFVSVVVLWFTFRYYPEKKAASQFFDALAVGDTDKAYELWKPSANYRKKDFLADWGPGGYYGPVKSYKLISSRAPKKSDSVAVTFDVSPYSPMPDISDVEKTRKTHTVTIWVQASDKSLSFPPF